MGSGRHVDNVRVIVGVYAFVGLRTYGLIHCDRDGLNRFIFLFFK
jgi:hypothetical protein